MVRSSIYWLSYKWGLGTLQREVQAKVKSPVPLYEYFRGVPSAHALGAGFFAVTIGAAGFLYRRKSCIIRSRELRAMLRDL